MKNLYETSASNEIRDRIASLKPESERRWGAMDVAQMLAHCSAWMAMAAGVTSQRQSLPGRLFGKLAKKSILKATPIRRNMPTDKGLIVADQRDFALEQQRLLDAVKQFAERGPELCTIHPHSFFGFMTPSEWATMGYKHLDHHLRQFGA